MTFKLTYLKSFKKDLDKKRLSSKHTLKLVEYVLLLANQESLPTESKDHELTGEWKDYREFHLGGDMLVIYKIDHEVDELKLVRIGTHNQLFSKY